GGDGHATFAKFAGCHWVIGIIAVEGGHVKRSREASLPLLEEVVKTGICVFRCPKACKHAHCPRLGAIHCWLHSTRVGIFTRKTQVAHIVCALAVNRCVQTLHRDAGGCYALFTLRNTLKRLPNGCLIPLSLVHC